MKTRYATTTVADSNFPSYNILITQCVRIIPYMYYEMLLITQCVRIIPYMYYEMLLITQCVRIIL